MLSTKKISKRYGKNEAVKEVSISIPQGSCYGLIGPNGSGKSTLMKMISSVIDEDSGEFIYTEKKKPSLGYVPQEISLEESLTAKMNIQFFGKIYHLKGKELNLRSETTLEAIGLLKRSNDKVNTFSGGMKRRLNIGCALMNDPELVIMDEPTVGVDPQSRKSIFSIIKRLKNEGKTIIYVSHYMEEIETLCDYVAFMDGGEIIEEGKVSDIIERYNEPAVFIKGDIPERLLDETSVKKEKNDGGWVLSTDNPLYCMERIATLCRENEIIPTQLSLTRPRLEDIFFKLTGTSLRDNSN